MNAIVPTLTPEQYDRYREYYNMAARPVFWEITKLKLGAGRRFTVTPTGELTNETFLFTPEEQRQLDELRDLLQTVQQIAMNEAQGIFGPQRGQKNCSPFR